MDEQTFQEKFAELMARIRSLPDDDRDRLLDLAEQTQRRHARIRESVTELQESLDSLRLSVKYLVFDLEATRRENAYLRRLVEQSQRDEHPQHGDHDHDSDVDDNFLDEGEA